MSVYTSLCQSISKDVNNLLMWFKCIAILPSNCDFYKSWKYIDCKVELVHVLRRVRKVTGDAFNP